MQSISTQEGERSMSDREHDRDEKDQNSRSDSPEQGELKPAGESQAAGPIVIETTSPNVASGGVYRSEWSTHPDRSMVIETSRIQEPSGPFNPGFVMVPVESEMSRPAGGGDDNQSRTDDKNGHGQKNGTAKDPSVRKGEQGEKDNSQHEKSGKEPSKAGQNQSSSMIRTMLIPAVIALVCGVGGAAGYSYFFGSEKSGDKSPSGKSSGSSKQSGSSKDSGSAKSAGSGSESDSSSGGESSSSGGSDSSQKAASKDQIRIAEEAWMTAVNQLHDVQNSEKEARRSEADMKAVLEFFKRTLLSAGRPGDSSLSDAFWAGGQGKDVTLKKALEIAESQVAESFADRPIAEAAAREMLGIAHLNIGEAPEAVKEYERALALREAMQGASQPDTSAVRNQLAVAYRLASRADQAGRLFDRNLNSPAQAASLAVRGSMLLFEKKPADAELKLRDSLTIRQKIQPDDWSTFETRSILGEALMDQSKFADAEGMLISGYEGMKQHEASIPAADKPRLVKALERIVKLYQGWGKADRAEQWRKTLEAAARPSNPHIAPTAF
jgi:tetratricopeptide (TPR) repeat protein